MTVEISREEALILLRSTNPKGEIRTEVDEAGLYNGARSVWWGSFRDWTTEEIYELYKRIRDYSGRAMYLNTSKWVID